MSSPETNQSVSADTCATSTPTQASQNLVAGSSNVSDSHSVVSCATPTPSQLPEQLAASSAVGQEVPIAPLLPTPPLSAEELLISLREVQTDLLNICNQVPSEGAQPVMEELEQLAARLTGLTALRHRGWMTITGKSSAIVFDKKPKFLLEFALFLTDSIYYLGWCPPPTRDLHLLSYRASATADDDSGPCTPMWKSLRAIQAEFLKACNKPAPPSGPATVEYHVQATSEYGALISQLRRLTGLKIAQEGTGTTQTRLTEELFQNEPCESFYFANLLYHNVLLRRSCHRLELRTWLDKSESSEA